MRLRFNMQYLYMALGYSASRACSLSGAEAYAEAYKRDIPYAIVKFYDTGHFALETHAPAIRGDIKAVLSTLPD